VGTPSGVCVPVGVGPVSPVVVVLPESGLGVGVGGTSVPVPPVVVVVPPESGLVVGVGCSPPGGGVVSGPDGVVVGLT